MLTAYFLIAAFVAGTFAGSTIETKDIPSARHAMALAFLALAWPLMIYICWKDWSDGQ